ncbi:MAG: manganese efflux pump, partial [Sulfobacillus sp.]
MFALEIDTLVTAMSLGMAGRSSRVWRYATAFALAEALMPIIGLSLGRVASGLLGRWVDIVAASLLVGLAVWMF